MKTETLSPAEIRARGSKALRKALGPIGAARFFVECGLGSGNYTEERRSREDQETLESIVARIQSRHRHRDEAGPTAKGTMPTAKSRAVPSPAAAMNASILPPHDLRAT